MAEKVEIDLEIKDNVKSLKSQLREAQAEVAALSEKFGATSREAVQAAKKAAELKDAIGDAKALTDAYNPDAKFNALTQSLSGVLNGFQAFEGALGLVGVEGEAVQETLLKVQSAMALAEGVNGVMESVESFKTLTTQIGNLSVVQKVATALQWLWNAAMAANPIGAIVVAITALIVAGYKLIQFFQESAEENERLTKSIDKHSAALKKQQQQIERSAEKQESYNNFVYEYAKASGKSAEELRKLALKHQEEELALARKNSELAKSTYLREKDILATMIAAGADEELIKKQREVAVQARENATKAREEAAKEAKELQELRRQQMVDRQQELTDAKREAEEKRKQEAEDAADRRKRAKENAEAEAERKKQEEEKNLTEEERRLKDAQDLRDRANEERIKKQDEYDQLQRELIKDDQEKEIAELVFAYEQKFAAASENAELEKELEEALKADIAAINDKYRKEKEAKDEEAAQKELERKEMLQEATFQMAKDGFNLLSGLTDLFASEDEAKAKRAFNVQKAISIASATVEGIEGTIAAYKTAQKSPITLAFPAYPIVQAGLAAGFAATNIAKIAKTQFNAPSPVNASGGGGGQQTTESGAAPTPANFNIVGNAGANPLAGLNEPIKAYVVGAEVTTQQALDNQKVTYATFG
jgi:hypothetical protein